MDEDSITNMFIVGVTGGIGTGKSTTCEWFKHYGVPVIDADTMARKVVEPGKKAWHSIKKEFGSTVFLPNGELNREVLGDVIFNDIEKRKKLNEITHPEIYKEMLWSALVYLFEGHQFIVMDLPLLFETRRMIGLLHKIIVVTCEKDQQLERVINRAGLSESRARQRIEAQMPLETKCEQAHFIIDNSGNIENIEKQVKDIVVLLQSSNAHWKLRLIVLLCMGCCLYILYWLFGSPKDI
ncbi:hypothetical protein B566_EDAN013374 [Ephemera danica]|nr:hypothetical protein B566_EDAN013374 [Ephemera danica]